MDDSPAKLDEEIEKSRIEIAKLQERVKALTARRGQRQAMAKQVEESVSGIKDVGKQNEAASPQPNKTSSTVDKR